MFYVCLSLSIVLSGTVILQNYNDMIKYDLINTPCLY